MYRLLVESYLLLIRIELLMRFGTLQDIYDMVRSCKTNDAARIDIPDAEELCHIMALGCVLFPKDVLCLQRSVATTLFLRRYSHRAELVIGTQILMNKEHAWVEIKDQVMNDKSYVPEIYQVLERC